MLTELRAYFRRVRDALPLLDAWRPPGLEPAFPGEADSAIPAPELQWYNRTKPPRSGLPCGLRASELSCGEAEAVVAKYPDVQFIYGTGERKILYDSEKLLALMGKYPNFYLATANLCNMLFFERAEELRMAEKLLYGSFMPFFDEGAALGPLILSRLPWPLRCGIAGNHLRRLLGMTPFLPLEPPPMPELPPFLIDAHAHTQDTPGGRVFAPCLNWRTARWLSYMDGVWTQKMFFMPSEAIADPSVSSLEVIGDDCRKSGGRMFFFEVFDPNDVALSLCHLEQSLPLPECVGIKLHPAEHRVSASDPRYAEAFSAARRFGKPVMTHSWEDSSYNPAQKLSCPHLFTPHLERFPDVKFVLGHAGGRPSTLPDVTALCARFPQIRADLAGDYFHWGNLRRLRAGLGIKKILYASDCFWMDPRCMMGMLLDSIIPDGELKEILYGNASGFFSVPGGTV